MSDATRTATSAEKAHEARLVAQAVGGNADAFASLYDLYIDRVYRFVFFRVGDEHTAEDLSAQVFMKAWENLERYEARGLPFGAWLFRIARNLVIDHYRARRDTASLDDVPPQQLAGRAEELDEAVANRLEASRLQQALAALTDDQRTVLVLKFIEGYSTEEIAEQLGKQQGAVRALQMRGLRALADIIEPDHDDQF